MDPSDYAPKEFIVQSSDREIFRFSQRFLAVSKMFTAVRQETPPEPAIGTDCSLSTTPVNRRGPPSMSRRVGHPWTEQMSRKKSRKVRETPSLCSRKRPERGQKCRQRLELGIHGLNRWAVNCLEMSRKRGVQTDRNGPSLPPCVAKAEMSTADRLGSREGSSRTGWRKPVGCVELAMTHRSASWHGSNAGHSPGAAGVDARRATPPDPRLARWGLASCCQLDPSHPALVTRQDPGVEPCLIPAGQACL